MYPFPAPRLCIVYGENEVFSKFANFNILSVSYGVLAFFDDLFNGYFDLGDFTLLYVPFGEIGFFKLLVCSNVPVSSR